MNQSLIIVGTGPESKALIPILYRLPAFRVLGLISAAGLDPSHQRLCKDFEIPRLNNLNNLSGKRIDLALICADKIPAHWQEAMEVLSINTIVPFEYTRVLSQFSLPLYKLLLEIEEQKEKYLSAINATSEGVQIINEHGIIEHINPSFVKILGVHPSDRIGQSIFEVSADGAGAKVLNSGLPAKGVCNKVTGSSAKVVSNGAPLVINGKQRGAVVLFQEINDILRLSKELQESKLKIETLHKELAHVKSSSYSFSDLVGNNKKLLEAINISQHAAQNDSTILITGESGTGKEILAQAIHQASSRWNKPFIAINCASIPDSLIESELLGHEKGAFTGAMQTKIGKFELANGGTIFLDEIGDLSINVQAKLLRVLQEKHFERVGSNERRLFDAKVLAATNRNLVEMVKRGLFRADLYYRLQVIHISLPPLRERKEDIPLLVEHFLLKISRKFNKPVPELNKDALKLLLEYSWPGNIRELENVLTSSMTVNDSAYLTKNSFKTLLERLPAAEAISEKKVTSLEEAEAQTILKALNIYGFTTSGKRSAARALNISLGTLYNKIKNYNLDKSTRTE